MFEPECPLSRNYVIPKPFDPRVVPHVARFVAEAAIRTGVARKVIDDFDAYEQSVTRRIARLS
jgi:malate dehydrogenase (oxaloacetate-decarboxylating)(NADP+)